MHTSVALRKGDYKDLARALQLVDLLDEAERVVADIGYEHECELALATLIERERLPRVFTDLLAYGSSVGCVRHSPFPQPMTVDALTPWLRVPSCALRAAYPIAAFIRGDVDDPLKMGERETHYLLVADAHRSGTLKLAEIESETFLQGLVAGESLDTLLRRTRNVTEWLGWLHGLAQAGTVAWLFPD